MSFQHIQIPTAKHIKNLISPRAYYSQVLEGQFGKSHKEGFVRTEFLCPFHGDTRPGSFAINTETGAYRCFSCGANGGDIIDFHRMRHNCSFKQTLADIGGLPNVTW